MKKWFLRSSVALLLFAILLSGFGCIGGGPKPEGDAASPPQTSKAQTSDSIKVYSPEIQSIIDELKENHGILVEVKASFPELGKWLAGLKKTISLLPKNVSSKIALGGTGQYKLPLKVEFVKKDIWSTGTIDPVRNAITINTTPNPRHPFPFEYLSENGYTEEEIIYAFLHEMGHLWDSRPENKNSYSSSYKKILSETGSPSVYGYHWDMLGDKATKTNAINPIEDFAESFAFYVLLPEYIKTNFPLRYNWFKDNVFHTEFGKNIYPIPSSMKARLTKSLIEDG